MTQTVRLVAVGSVAPLAAHFLTTPESRGLVLLIAAMLCWTLDAIPDYVVALGVIVVWNVAGIGPSAASLSGFSSSVWFLLLGVLAVGGGLASSGVLQRLALALLSMFPALAAEAPEAARVKRWLGHRPSLPDGLPCIGASAASADVVLAFGHGHVGLCGSARSATWWMWAAVS